MVGSPSRSWRTGKDWMLSRASSENLISVEILPSVSYYRWWQRLFLFCIFCFFRNASLCGWLSCLSYAFILGFYVAEIEGLFDLGRWHIFRLSADFQPWVLFRAFSLLCNGSCFHLVTVCILGCVKGSITWRFVSYQFTFFYSFFRIIQLQSYECMRSDISIFLLQT